MLHALALTELDRGHEADGLLSEAVALFAAAHSAGTEISGSAMADHATALVLTGRVDDAVELTATAVSMGGLPPERVVTAVAARMSAAGQGARAHAMLLQALELGPASAEMLAALEETAANDEEATCARLASIELLLDAARFDDALEVVDRLVEVAQVRPQASAPVLRIGVLLAAGRTEDAVAAGHDTFFAHLLEAPRTIQLLGVALAAAGRGDVVRQVLEEHASRAAAPPSLVSAAALLTATRVAEALEELEHLPSDPIALRLRAAAHERLGAWAEAAAALQAVLDTAPDDSDLLAALARLDALAGNSDTALSQVESRLSRRPWDALLLGARAVVQVVRGQYPDAIRSAEHALSIEPSLEAPRTALAHGLVESGEIGQGIVEADHVLRRDPDNFDALFAKGRALMERGDPDAAVAVLTKLKEVAPWHRAGMMLLGAALEAAHQPGAALAVYEGILAEVPRDTEPYVAAARVAWQGWNLRHAEDLLTRALKIDPDDPESHASMAEVLRRAGRLTEAEPHLRRALDQKPDNATWLGTLGQLTLAKGDRRAGRDLLVRAAALDPSLAWVHAELGDVQRLEGNLDEALASLDAAIAADPRDAWPRAGRAAALLALERFDEALAEVDRALACQGDYGFAWAVKSSVHVQIDQIDEAREALDRAIHADARTGWLWATHGYVQWLAAAPAAEVVASLHRALDLDEHDVHARMFLGYNLLRAGDVEGARSAFGAVAADLEARRREGDPQAMNATAWALLGLRDWPRAADLTAEVTALDPRDPTLLLDYGVAVLCATAAEEVDDLDTTQYEVALTRVARDADARHGAFLLRLAERSLDDAELVARLDPAADALLEALGRAREMIRNTRTERKAVSDAAHTVAAAVPSA